MFIACKNRNYFGNGKEKRERNESIIWENLNSTVYLNPISIMFSCSNLVNQCNPVVVFISVKL